MKTLLSCLSWAALSCTILAARPVTAQEPESASPPAVGDTLTAATSLSLRYSDLLRREVILQNGDVVGEINELIVGPRGSVDFLVAANGDQMFAIPYHVVNFNRAGQVQLTLMPAQFDQLPFFSLTQWPNFNSPAFRQKEVAVFGPTGIGPAPNASAPVVSRSEAVNPTDQERAARAGDPETNFPINNRVETKSIGGAKTAEDSKKLNTSPRAAGYRGPARPPVPGVDAPATAPDAPPPSPNSGRPQSRSGPAPRPSSTGEYNQGSATLGGTGGSSGTGGASSGVRNR